MSYWLTDILTHKIFIEVAIAFILCQTIKLVTKSIAHKKFYPMSFLENGGMPSSHTTASVALAVSIGLNEGFGTSVFFLAGLFALIVMRDAFGVRHNVDMLEHKVNQIITKKKVHISKAKMTSGHTFVQVATGFLLATSVVLFVHFVTL